MVEVLGLRFQVLGSRVQVLGLRVQGLGFRVLGLGSRVIPKFKGGLSTLSRAPPRMRIMGRTMPAEMHGSATAQFRRPCFSPLSHSCGTWKPEVFSGLSLAELDLVRPLLRLVRALVNLDATPMTIRGREREFFTDDRLV